MKLLKNLKFRLIRIQKLSRLQITVRVFVLLSVVFAAAAVMCRMTLEKDYKSNVHKGVEQLEYNGHITVSVLNVPLYIYPSDSDRITVSYVCDSPVSVYTKSGRLYIEQEPSLVVSLFTADWADYGVELYLPRQEYRSLRINTTSGDVTGEDISAFRLEVTSKSGDVSLSGLRCSSQTAIDLADCYAEISFSSFAGGTIVNEKGTAQLYFDEDISVSTLIGSSCTVNGEEIKGNMQYGNGAALAVTSPQGRVRISTALNKS